MKAGTAPFFAARIVDLGLDIVSMNFPVASFVWFFVPFWRVLLLEISVFVRGDPPPQRGGPPAAATSRGLALSFHLAHPTLESDFNKGFKRPTSGSIITSRPNAHFVDPLSGRQCVPTDVPDATSYTLCTHPLYQFRPLNTRDDVARIHQRPT